MATIDFDPIAERFSLMNWVNVNGRGWHCCSENHKLSKTFSRRREATTKKYFAKFVFSKQQCPLPSLTLTAARESLWSRVKAESNLSDD